MTMMKGVVQFVSEALYTSMAVVINAVDRGARDSMPNKSRACCRQRGPHGDTTS